MFITPIILTTTMIIITITIIITTTQILAPEMKKTLPGSIGFLFFLPCYAQAN